MVKNKVIIITGGAQGIGKACSLKLAEEGAHIICGDIDEKAGLELLREWEQEDKKEGSIDFIQFDASKGKDCEKLVNFTFSKFGRIDVLFNNVGIQPKESYIPIHLLNEEMWDQIFNVNIKSFFWMTKYCIPHMLKRTENGKYQCSIINNASIQGLQSQKGVSAYAATKGAIQSLTRQLACEYGPFGIRVNTISPGTIMTELAIRNNQSFSYIEQNTPLKTCGEPKDIAEIVLFLASDNAKWITGQNFIVDGGITIKGGWSPL
jgi:NAD(P)-dependent dehydrogenase (short-subunit alcohol dehydrogenase family)